MKKLIVLLVAFSIFTACQKDDLFTEQEVQENTARQSVERLEPGEDLREHTKIVLGEKRENPYSVKNMQKAFDYYNSKVTNSTYKRKVVKPTHYYIKITPNTEADLIALDKLDNSDAKDAIHLQDFPMDYEVIKEGDYYIDPKDESDLYYPAYTAIPVGYKLPNGLSYEVLEELYKPKQEEGDVEITSWVLTGDKEDVEAELASTLREADLAQYLNRDTSSEDVNARRRYRPQGHILIENTETNQIDPLKQAKLSIGRWFWWHYTYTHDDGYFSSPARFRGRVKVRAKWRGYTATIRKSWNEMLGLWVSDHLMVIKRRTNPRTRVIHRYNSHLWYKGTTHNALRKYVDYADSHGINHATHYANVWTWKDGKGITGATPMFYKYPQLNTMAVIAGIGESQFWDVAINYAMSNYIIGLIPIHLRPDHLFRGLKNYGQNTARIEQTIFHESGHYSHASQAGAWFWAKVYASEVGNIATNGGDPYVDGVSPSQYAGKRIALAEGWATFMEFKVMDAYYNMAMAYTDNYYGWNNNVTSMLEGFDVCDTPMTIRRYDDKSWFLHGLFTDILDNHIDLNSKHRSGNGAPVGLVIDYLYIGDGYNLNYLYRYLDKNAHSAGYLRKRLLNDYPQLHTQINKLFNSYGY